MTNKPRFVFDTNALVSVALLSKSVNKLALQKAELLGEIVFSDETLSELRAVLVRTKFDRYLSLEDRLNFFDRLEARYKVITVTSNFEDCRDTKDNKFLNLAFDSEAIVIIT